MYLEVNCTSSLPSKVLTLYVGEEQGSITGSTLISSWGGEVLCNKIHLITS